MNREIYDSAMRNGFARAALNGVLAWIVLVPAAFATTDWGTPAQQLAAKIAAFSGPGAVAFSVQNRSSLSAKEVETITADLRSQLEALGLHAVEPERAAGSVAVSLSESPRAYVWVA